MYCWLADSLHTYLNLILQDTRHTGRFLSLYMLLLPVALHDVFLDKTLDYINYFDCLLLIPTTAILGLFLFGIDELAIQLEEPFSILPMQNFCDKLQKSTKTITDCLEWMQYECMYGTCTFRNNSNNKRKKMDNGTIIIMITKKSTMIINNRNGAAYYYFDSVLILRDGIQQSTILLAFI